MARKITKKQKAFADKHLETGNGTKSALETYDTQDENTAAVIASENLRKPKIIEYLEGHGKNAATEIVRLGLKANNENVRLGANKDILDRIGLKPTEKHEVQVFTLEDLFKANKE